MALHTAADTGEQQMARSNKQPSFTKSGPGRRSYTKNERAKNAPTLRQKTAGAYGRGLMAHFNRKIAAACAERAQRRALA